MSEGNERGRSRLPLFGSFRWKGGGAGDKVADKTVTGLVVEGKLMVYSHLHFFFLRIIA